MYVLLELYFGIYSRYLYIIHFMNWAKNILAYALLTL